MGTLLTVDSTTGQVTTPRVRITPEGGIAVLLTCNQPGGVAKGDVVKADPAIDSNFIKAAISDQSPIGVVYDAAIAQGAQGWVVVAGIADVRLDGVGGPVVRGWWLGTSATTAGQAVGLAVVGFNAQHFTEIGHVIVNPVGTLARAIIHFN